MSIKEIIGVKGFIHSNSCPTFADNIATEDAEIVARLKKAGAIVIGTTTMSEMGLSYDTNSPIYGRTKNPKNEKLSAGGSSGGEAAASAARLRPVGIGGDVGGGIRLAALFCDTTGLRSTVGRVPQLGIGINNFIDRPVTARFAGYGPMGIYIEDLELIFSVIAGPFLADPHTFLAQPYRYGASEQVNISELRIAAFPGIFNSTVTPKFSAAVQKLRADEKIGVHLPNPLTLARKLWGIDGGKGLLSVMKKSSPSELCRESRWHFEMIDGHASESPEQVIGLIQRWDRYKQLAAKELFSDADVIIFPVTLRGVALEPEECGDFEEITPTISLSLIGVPVCVVAGVQVAALHQREDLVFAVSKKLQGK